MYLDDLVRKANRSIFEYPVPLKYLYKRGLADEDIKNFFLGYTKLARIPEADCEDYRYLYDSTYKFKSLQNKIIFPLHNLLGRVNGIETRDLEKKRYVQYLLSEAKLLGSFFGIAQALPSIQKTKKVFVHEGAINSISFSKVFPNSISSLTSFLNEQQYETLRFLADTIILVFDDDSTGNLGVAKMTERYGPQYLSSVNLGSGDSNSLLSSMGIDKFRKYVTSKVPFLYRE